MSTAGTLVVIGLNEGERLQACLKSVLSEQQSNPDFEIVYVDSGSTDGSLDTARALDIRTIALPRATAASARNAGLAASHGNLIHFVDGDMVMAEGWLGQARAALESTGAAAVTGFVVEEENNASIYSRVYGHDWSRQGGYVQQVGGAALWRRDVLVELGGFDETLPVGEDPDLALRALALGHKLLEVPSGMVYHRLELTSALDWIRRGVSVGRSSAFVRHRHPQARGARRRIQRAIRDLTAAVLAIAVALLWPSAIPYILLPGLLVLLWQAGRELGRKRPFGIALARVVHIHLSKIPFAFGAASTSITYNRRSRQ